MADRSDMGSVLQKQTFSLRTDYMAGMRAAPLPFYPAKRTVENKSGIDGRHLYDFLISDYLESNKRYFNRINDWFVKKFEGWKIHVNVDSEPYKIELRKGKLHINLTQTGMGIGQVLPLIIRAFKPCDEKTLIIVEEPESHLHPAAHAELSQSFVESLEMDENKQYLFETHSLNFVLRFRRLVAEGKMNKDDLAIYYIDFNEELNESVLKQIQVDEGGGVDYWPEGVFSETRIETRAIYNARLNDTEDVGRN